MDRRRRPLGLLIATLAGALAGAAAAGEAKLQALTWIAAGHEREALTRQPATCLAASDPQIEAGRALFDAPQLLGGQAARAGVSCASCHSNGRRNPHFALAGVSREPGTADVTASFFSASRGNARFDPVAIPDLAQPGRISRDPRSDDLERFLRGLIVDEFSGSPPSPGALSALAAYVRELRSCPDRNDEPRTMAAQIALVRGAVAAAARFASAGDRPTAALLIASARRQLGLIDERLAPFGNAAARRRLLAGSRSLQAIAITPEALGRWQAGFEARTLPVVLRPGVRTLYEPDAIAKWLARERPSGSLASN